jgi:ABC-type branched-subunit amino acid transport system ATPase component
VAHRPAVILLDEPTSGIAQREVEALAPVVRRLRDEMGASLVIVEHDIPFMSTCLRSPARARPGPGHRNRTPRRRPAHPDVVESYLGTSGAAIARSGGTE